MSEDLLNMLPPTGRDRILVTLGNGRSKMIYRNDNKGTPVSSDFQTAAARLGCMTLAMTAPKAEDPQKENLDKTVEIAIEAIGKLTDEDFNSNGTPNFDAVKKAAGINLTKAQYNKAWIQYQELHGSAE